MTFKIGDRVRVGPQGLINVKKAAGRAAEVIQIGFAGLYYLQFDHPIESSQGECRSQWWGEPESLTLINPEEGSPPMPIPFHLVWHPAGFAPHHQHPDYESALKEATRLSEKEPGKEFYVLAPVSRVVTKSPVEVTTFKNDESPF